jgi:hypothetical protein
MDIVAQLRSLTAEQRSAVVASFLGWTLDAFDFFLLVFVIKDIAAEFHSDVTEVTFPGFTYQLGNLLASANATIQAQIAQTHGGNYGLGLAIVAGIVAVAVILLTWFGREAKGVAFGREAAESG